jgi:hypothetical protein
MGGMRIRVTVDLNKNDVRGICVVLDNIEAQDPRFVQRIGGVSLGRRQEVRQIGSADSDVNMDDEHASLLHRALIRRSQSSEFGERMVGLFGCRIDIAHNPVQPAGQPLCSFGFRAGDMTQSSGDFRQFFDISSTASNGGVLPCLFDGANSTTHRFDRHEISLVTPSVPQNPAFPAHRSVLKCPAAGQKRRAGPD